MRQKFWPCFGQSVVGSISVYKYANVVDNLLKHFFVYFFCLLPSLVGPLIGGYRHCLKQYLLAWLISCKYLWTYLQQTVISPSIYVLVKKFPGPTFTCFHFTGILRIVVPIQLVCKSYDSKNFQKALFCYLCRVPTAFHCLGQLHLKCINSLLCFIFRVLGFHV